MYIIFKRIILLVLILSVNVAIGADANVADEYLKAYSSFDLTKMEAFYSKDAKFLDPTSEIWGEYAFIKNSKEEILKGLESFLSQYDEISLEYIIKEKYESAGHNIYTGKAKMIYEKSGTVETSCAAITTIITVKAGKVVEHRDYFDYKTAADTRKAGDQDC